MKIFRKVKDLLFCNALKSNSKMSKISAQVIADSLNPYEKRITTMVVTFPRIILAEFNTHRMFSRNSASSRAIPFEKMVESVKTNPFIPIAWQKDHKGMQGTEYFNESEVDYGEFKEQWLSARDSAVDCAKSLSEGITYSKGIDSGDRPSEETTVGLTKQLCNRLLEPFMWHTVIVTATEWENFFALRCPQYTKPFTYSDNSCRSKKDWYELAGANENGIVANGGEDISKTDLEWLQLNKGQAEIHMMALAEAMWDALNESTPKKLSLGDWHIPFAENITVETLRSSKEEELMEFTDFHKVKVSTAMCARVSYTVVGEEGKAPNYENDLKLHDRLAASGHWSPFEHCAKAVESPEPSGNFTYGWEQYRKTFQNENIKL